MNIKFKRIIPIVFFTNIGLCTNISADILTMIVNGVGSYIDKICCSYNETVHYSNCDACHILIASVSIMFSVVCIATCKAYRRIREIEIREREAAVYQEL